MLCLAKLRYGEFKRSGFQPSAKARPLPLIHSLPGIRVSRESRTGKVKAESTGPPSLAKRKGQIKG